MKKEYLFAIFLFLIGIKSINGFYINGNILFHSKKNVLCKIKYIF